MAHDLVIRGGNIADGNGGDVFTGDVAIDDDTITAVGQVDGKGRQEIDADGLAVMPGFVDLHTHLDAQVSWDPLLTPVTWHGITTALFGNCGVTFAPCKPKDREFLAEMMENVEDIPKQAILKGLPWDWESYGEYLDSVEKMDPAINMAGLVGHCATRFYVMGERSIDYDANPTDDELRQMSAIAAKSVADGAVGFSSNRLPGHTLPDGRSIPGTYAEERELVALAKAVGDNGGFMQNVLNYGKLDEEMELVAQQARAGNCRVLFSAPMTQRVDGYDSAIKSMRDEGLDVSGITVPRSGGFLSGLKTDIMFTSPAWIELRKHDLEGRLEHLEDHDFRQRLIDEIKDQSEGGIMRTQSFFWVGDGDQPDYMQSQERSLHALAQAAGKHPVELWIEKALETRGEGFYHVRFFNQDLVGLETMLKADWVMPGLGDAGAHVSQIMDSGWATFFLSHWHREKGLFSLAEAANRLGKMPARVLGFTDRGVLEVGKRADINVIDIDTVAERQPELVHDFPFGAPRLIQRARGYKATVCNGTVILRDDEHTGDRGGRVLRNGRA